MAENSSWAAGNWDHPHMLNCIDPRTMLTFHPNPKPWHPSTPTNFSSIPFKARSFPSRIANSINEKNEPKQSSAGKIKRLVLTQEGRTKFNAYPDREFYAYPRFVTHVDSGFISTLTDLYRERLSPGSEILDLMSSWDLNQDQKLESDSCNFDAVLCTVSVQYLQYPEKVFAEVFRVLRPGGVFIVSFSNRLFYEKAISAWRDGTAYSRVQLVVQYFQCVEGFTQPETIRKLPATNGAQEDKGPLSWIARLLGFLSGSDPFYAVIAYKNFKPLYE
ncbi:hypothetical protein CK203_091706 [Vitis vinifera]|uniref:Methyltransferase type 11 domain-containing protein n=1 Tax=Vitis vinifera TaxID=29760 RepID=A0A438D1S5_VITVI|nr:hypothetical protein CK203_091706 [Vitis vinifera]